MSCVHVCSSFHIAHVTLLFVYQKKTIRTMPPLPVLVFVYMCHMMCMCICMYVSMCLCVCVCVCMWVCVCVCVREILWKPPESQRLGTLLQRHIDSSACVTWLVHMCDVNHTHVTWLSHMWDVTHSNAWHPYVWHDSFMCVIGLILMCDMTESHVRRETHLKTSRDILCCHDVLNRKP